MLRDARALGVRAQSFLLPPFSVGKLQILYSGGVSRTVHHHSPANVLLKDGSFGLWASRTVICKAWRSSSHTGDDAHAPEAVS